MIYLNMRVTYNSIVCFFPIRFGAIWPRHRNQSKKDLQLFPQPVSFSLHTTPLNSNPYDTCTTNPMALSRKQKRQEVRRRREADQSKMGSVNTRRYLSPTWN